MANQLNLSGVVIPLSDETVNNLLVQLGVKTPKRIFKFMCSKGAGNRAGIRNKGRKATEPAGYHIGCFYAENYIIPNLMNAQDNGNAQSDFYTESEVKEIIVALQDLIAEDKKEAKTTTKKK